MLLPSLASAGLIRNVVHQVSATVQHLAGNTGEPRDGSASAPQSAAAPDKAGEPPNYTPPLHGTNPHGQGTIGVIDIAPEDTEPLPYDPNGGSEDVVVGSARGEQLDNGDYHGHITIAAVLGNEVLGVDTGPGETEAGPLDAIQTQILDAVCDGSGNQVCLEVLTADSSTTGSGSTNHFAVTEAQIGGATGITAGVAHSDGNIEDDGTCQTAHGSSSVANASVGGALTADVINSSADSEACNDGTPDSQENDSKVININGTGLGIPAAGCANGTPNTDFTTLVPLASAVCNADDENGDQTSIPYGVREGLSVFVIPIAALLKVSTAPSESHAVAPALKPPPPPPSSSPPPRCENPPCEKGGKKGGGGGGNEGAGPGGGQAGQAENLPFTGSDLATLLLIGLGVMVSGLGAMALADRRRPPVS